VQIPEWDYRDHYAGALVAVSGLLAAVLIEPQADLRRFRRT
jgi:hypothetical protein